MNSSHSTSDRKELNANNKFQEEKNNESDSKTQINNPEFQTKDEIDIKNEDQGIKRRFQPNQFLKFSSLILVPGKPRKWKRVQRRFGKNEGAWLYRWEYIPESIDNIFMENLELMARGVVGPRRTGRTTRAVSFHMRENIIGSSNIGIYEVDGNFD